VTGRRLYENTMKNINKSDLANNHEILPYINDMPYALKACDMIICSAGAITIAEITAVGKAAILIPKAHTAENHQEYNADAMGNKGAAVVIREDELSGELLNKKIEEILNSSRGLKTMKAASKNEGITDAADRIYKEVENLIKKH